MKAAITSIIAMVLLFGCALPIQKTYLKPHTNMDSPDASVVTTSNLIGYAPQPKNEIIIDKNNITLTLHADSNKKDIITVYLSIDPYVQPVTCHLEDIKLIDMSSNSIYSPSNIIRWHHGPHLNDNYMEEITGHVNLSQLQIPKDIRVNENRFYLKYQVEALATRKKLSFSIPRISLSTSSGELVFGPITFEEITELMIYFPGTM